MLNAETDFYDCSTPVAPVFHLHHLCKSLPQADGILALAGPSRVRSRERGTRAKAAIVVRGLAVATYVKEVRHCPL
jgi:hypothetical protein